MDRWILVVARDVFDREIIGRAAMKLPHRESAIICEAGYEALNVISNAGSLPAMVLLDGRLPDGYSIETLKALRSGTQTSLVPIIVFSDDRRERTAVEALKNGANSYILKATASEQMVDRVLCAFRYWLDVNQSITPQQEEFSSPSVDAGNKQKAMRSPTPHLASLNP